MLWSIVGYFWRDWHSSQVCCTFTQTSPSSMRHCASRTWQLHYPGTFPFQLAAILISLPFAIIVLIPPESPRWLFANEKDEEGMRVSSLQPYAILHKLRLRCLHFPQVSKIMGRLNKKPIQDDVWKEAQHSLEDTKVCKLKFCTSPSAANDHYKQSLSHASPP